jgi:ferredoxin
MHATIQKSLGEIIDFLEEGEKVFIVGCGNCAEKCRSGGQQETQQMRQRLLAKGVNVVGAAATESGKSLCKLSLARNLLTVEYKEQAEKADSFLVLACGQGIHTVIDATGGAKVHPGCNTIFGGETVTDEFITEYCSLCGECIVETTGGLCPLTLCSKGLLNGPCGGAKDGKCEVNPDRDCGWILIFERLKELGKTENLYTYRKPKNNLKWNKPRTLKNITTSPIFVFDAGQFSPLEKE